MGALGCGSKGERVRVFERGRVSAEKKEGERGHGVGRERYVRVLGCCHVAA